MNRVWLVARREYIEHVKTRSFIVGIVLLPLLVTGSVVIQKLLNKADTGGDVVVVDTGEGLVSELIEAYPSDSVYRLRAESVSGDPAEMVGELSAKVGEKEILAFFVLGRGLVEGTGELFYYTPNVSKDEPRESVQKALTEVVRRNRFEVSGVQPQVVEAIYAPLSMRDYDLTTDGTAEFDSDVRELKQFIPMIFVYLMFIGIMGQSQTMLTSTVEEKSNRVMEVLLSSVSPFQLMAGKMIGLGLVSLTLFLVWAAGGAYMIARHDLHQLITMDTLIYFLVYFFLGFMIYAAIMAAMGSVCNDLKEAQNLMTPMVVIMIVPLAIMYWVGKNPDHVLGQALSFVPLFTPFLMINRISSALPPGPLEIALSMVVLCGAIVFTVWLAARVFRVGVLLYGKPPALGEVVRWMREA